jgi:hypothetical protein
VAPAGSVVPVASAGSVALAGRVRRHLRLRNLILFTVANRFRSSRQLAESGQTSSSISCQTLGCQNTRWETRS